MRLAHDRYFDPEPSQRKIALEIFDSAVQLPIISAHGHVDPALFVDEKTSFGTPCQVFIIPDHYVYRMLYSQGIAMEDIGVPRIDGGHFEDNHRKIWQIFAENFHLFRGTPTGAWLDYELSEVFGIEDRLNAKNAQDIYEQLESKLALPEFKPRALFQSFGIQVLCTTDHAYDRLDYHRMIRESGWSGDIRPTFRPDSVVNLDTPGWQENISKLSDASGIDITSYRTFLLALKKQREYFKRFGAVSTDHAAQSSYTTILSNREATRIFQHALKGSVTLAEAKQFTGHMIVEMARMSIEDGLVMQLHPGSFRDHNVRNLINFGPNTGADIPICAEYTRNLRPLLELFGNDPRLTLILFTLDESTYSRELAPLAGHYPAVKLGPPWWFFDSLNGIRRYFDLVMETAGIYNTVGFNDDTRAFPSIPARHDLWRRASANWLASMTIRHIINLEDAVDMMADLAHRLVERAYRINSAQVNRIS